VTSARGVEVGSEPAAAGLLQVELAVARSLAETTTVSDTLRNVLSAIGTTLAWDVGIIWKVTPRGDVLRCVEVWDTGYAEATEFRTLSEQTTFQPGEGLPGRVWAGGKAAWITDVCVDSNFPRARAAAASGLHAAFGFPIRGPGGILGVMEFLTRRLREPDELLLGSMTVAGSLIGQWVVRRQAEEAVHEREALNRAVLGAALDPVITMDYQGRILEFNQAAERVFGYTRDAVLGKDMADLVIPPSLRESHRRGLARYLETGQPTFLEKRVELTGMRADGSEFPVELAITKIGVTGVPIFTGFLRDITDRKRAEEELKASRVRLVETADTERRRLERDLHDGAQQHLIALTLKLGLVSDALEEQPEVARRLLDDMQIEIAVALEELRELARGIHPAVLTERGLTPALAALGERSPVRVELTALPTERLSDAVEVAAYYVVSEALANIAKHARAERAKVSVMRAGEHVVVEVGDEGIGGADPMAGSGLRGLIDRVEALGGRVVLESTPGVGTRLRAEIPTS
jgi:PAS domain S-box-containing protein